MISCHKHFVLSVNQNTTHVRHRGLVHNGWTVFWRELFLSKARAGKTPSWEAVTEILGQLPPIRYDSEILGYDSVILR